MPKTIEMWRVRLDRLSIGIAGAAMSFLLTASSVGPRRPTVDFLRFAAELSEEGDRYYRQGQYSQATFAYMHSYFNHGNAHAHLMAGDSHVRATLAFNQQKKRSVNERCALDNEHFASNMTWNLDAHYRSGLALAAQDKAPLPRAAEIYRRSRDIAACLDVIQQEYAAKPKSACVDLVELSRCMGEPLQP